MQVEEASALEDTLARLRQRYALHFYLPEGATASDHDSGKVDLSQEAKMRYQEAEIRYRRIYMSGDAGHSGPTVVSRASVPVEAGTGVVSRDQEATPESTTSKHRTAPVNEDSGPRINTIDPDSGDSGRQTSPAKTPAQPPTGGLASHRRAEFETELRSRHRG